MNNQSEKYRLLAGSDDEAEESLQLVERPSSPSRWRRTFAFATVGFMLSSVLLNAWFLRDRHAMLLRSKDQAFEDSTSRFAGIKYTEKTPIYWSTEYGPGIGTPEDRDRVWEELDISPGVIALPDSYADEMGLPRSQRFPWDQSHGVYLLSTFHSIHCLKQIQRAISVKRRGLDEPINYGHIEHCLDNLLQDIFCHADDTPWYQLPPESERGGYARFQERTCRSWDDLLDWTKTWPACYRYGGFDMPANLTTQEEELEHYRFCEPGSQFDRNMHAYYERKERKKSAAKEASV